MKRVRKSKDRVAKAKDRSDQELRTIGAHVGRIITNAQADENHWRQYAVSRPPLIVEFMRLSGGDLAKLKQFMKDIAAWERGARMVRLDHLKS